MAKLGPSLWDDPNYVLGSIIPRNKGFDLGSPELPFRTLYVENATPIGANLHLTGNLEVDGTSTLTGGVSVGADIGVTGNVNVGGGVTVLLDSTFLGNISLVGTLGALGGINTPEDISITAAGATLVMGSAALDADATAGTFTANEATEVVIATTSAAANMTLQFGLNTIGGTPAGAPYMSSVTPGVSFGVKAAVGDTSVYNWNIIKNNIT